MPVYTNEPESILPETILIHGPMGTGKTTLAATESAFFPKDIKWPFKVRPHVTLEDMIWIKADTDAITGFGEMGFVIPQENVIDASHILPEEIVTSLNQIYKLAFDAANKLKTRKLDPIIVIDTLSVLDTLIVADASARIEGDFDEDDTKKKSDNSFAVWRRVLNVHLPFFARMKSIKARKRFLSHQTVKGEMVASKDPTQRAMAVRKRNAMGFADGAIGAALTGKSWEFYHQQCSLVMMIEKRVKQDPVTQIKTYECTIRPHGKADIVTKTRYQCLSEIEPADFRVINEKIRKAKL